MFQPIFHDYQCTIFFRFQVEHFAKNIIDFSNSRTGRANHLDFRVAPAFLFTNPQRVFLEKMAPFRKKRLVPAAYEHRQQIFHGRVAHQRPVTDFFLVKCRVILPGRGLYRIVFGTVGLYHGLARLAAPPCAPRRLRKKLERPLPAAVIVAIEGHVRRQDADQGNVWKIVSLDNHLRPHQDIRLLVGKRRQDFFMPVLFPCRIHVHAKHPRRRKPCLHDFLDLLGAGPKLPDVLRAALRAGRRPRLLMSTIMAHQLPPLVGREGNVTMRTFDDMPAFPAGNKPGITAPIQKQHDLLFFLQAIVHPFYQLAAQNRTVAIF